MFTGLIETMTSLVTCSVVGKDCMQLELQRPPSWLDLQIGDSIAVNGMCLTLEAVTQENMRFSLAYETLKVLLGRDFHDFHEEWQSEHGRKIATWLSRPIHVERAMRMDSRWGGHILTGRVDTMSMIHRSFAFEQSWILEIELPEQLKPYVWVKGNIAVEGVSLTVNEVHDHFFQVCLIPETQKRTHLKHLQPGDEVSLEADFWAKAVAHVLSQHPMWHDLNLRLEALERRRL